LLHGEESIYDQFKLEREREREKNNNKKIKKPNLTKKLPIESVKRYMRVILLL
jgi:hypothetical protein